MLVLLFVAALGASATTSGTCAAGSATTFTTDPDTRICIPDLGTPLLPKMFFRYEVAVEGYE